MVPHFVSLKEPWRGGGVTKLWQWCTHIHLHVTRLPLALSLGNSMLKIESKWQHTLKDVFDTIYFMPSTAEPYKQVIFFLLENSPKIQLKTKTGTVITVITPLTYSLRSKSPIISKMYVFCHSLLMFNPGL
jgi:hypothetical protein